MVMQIKLLVVGLSFRLTCFVGKMAYQGDLLGCVVDFGKIEDGKVPVGFYLKWSGDV